ASLPYPRAGDGDDQHGRALRDPALRAAGRRARQALRDHCRSRQWRTPADFRQDPRDALRRRLRHHEIKRRRRIRRTGRNSERTGETMRLENRKVIITGAAQGMGGVITRKLAAEGAELFLTARTRGPLEELATDLKAQGIKVDLLEGDCTVEKDVEAVVAAALKFFGGRIDVLVNAAGATGPIETPVWELNPDDFLDLLRKNIVGPFLPMKHVLP